MIVLLNGSINSGKTTVGKHISSMGIEVAHIEVDSIRDFIRWMPLKESIPLNLENAVSVALNLNKRKIDSVITIPLSEVDYEYFSSCFTEAGVEWTAIALNPGLEVLKMNRGNRELTKWELSRIDELDKEGSVNPSFGQVIDNSNMPIEDTAMKVLELAGLNKFRLSDKFTAAQQISRS